MFGCVCAVYAVHHLIGEVWPAAKANYGRESQRKHEQERHRKKVTRFSGYLRINTEKMYYRMDVKVFICTFSNMPWQSCKGWGGDESYTHTAVGFAGTGAHINGLLIESKYVRRSALSMLSQFPRRPLHTQRERKSNRQKGTSETANIKS